MEQPVWTQTANGANKKLVLHVPLRCGSLSITTPVSHLANEFDVWSEMHGAVSLAAVNQILCHSWGYERLQKSKDSLKVCFENVNVHKYFLMIKSMILLYPVISIYQSCSNDYILLNQSSTRAKNSGMSDPVPSWLSCSFSKDLFP